ncbi:uncharacterized protein ACWYII_021606 [Salvelinus alpinus]
MLGYGCTRLEMGVQSVYEDVARDTNRSTDDAISIALHTALSHLDKRSTYVRMLFIDYSSVFNTIVPSKLIAKLRTLGLNTSLCNWILDFLTGCPQVVRVGNNSSAKVTLNMEGPSGVFA